MATAFVLVVHVGILMLFTSGLVEYRTSQKGRLMLFEGETGSSFKSYFDWEIVARERRADGTATEFVLGTDVLSDLDPRDTARFRSDRLPFDVVVTSWTRNGDPKWAGGEWRIVPRPPEMQAEANAPGAVVTLDPKNRAEPVQRTWLWGGPVPGAPVRPWAVRAGGRAFEVELRQVTWPLPFSIELTRFVHRKHPGIATPARFSSYVTKREDGSSRDVHITMNAPLRHRGYTLYQSGWGPENAPEGARLYSVFSVVRNPSDQWPLYACIVIFSGLLLHFVSKLFRFVGRSVGRTA
jgi:hypothetical protein